MKDKLFNFDTVQRQIMVFNRLEKKGQEITFDYVRSGIPYIAGLQKPFKKKLELKEE